MIIKADSNIMNSEFASMSNQDIDMNNNVIIQYKNSFSTLYNQYQKITGVISQTVSELNSMNLTYSNTSSLLQEVNSQQETFKEEIQNTNTSIENQNLYVSKYNSSLDGLINNNIDMSSSISVTLKSLSLLSSSYLNINENVGDMNSSTENLSVTLNNIQERFQQMSSSMESITEQVSTYTNITVKAQNSCTESSDISTSTLLNNNNNKILNSVANTTNNLKVLSNSYLDINNNISAVNKSTSDLSIGLDNSKDGLKQISVSVKSMNSQVASYSNSLSAVRNSSASKNNEAMKNLLKNNDKLSSSISGTTVKLKTLSSQYLDVNEGMKMMTTTTTSLKLVLKSAQDGFNKMAFSMESIKEKIIIYKDLNIQMKDLLKNLLNLNKEFIQEELLIKQLTKTINEMNKSENNSALKSFIKILKKLASSISYVIQSLKKLSKEFTNLDMSISHVEKILKELGKDFSNTSRKVVTLISDVLRLKSSISYVIQSLKKLSKEFTNLDMSISHLEKILKGLGKDFSSISKEVVALISDISKLNELFDKEEVGVKKVSKALQEMNKQSNTKPVSLFSKMLNKANDKISNFFNNIFDSLPRLVRETIVWTVAVISKFEDVMSSIQNLKNAFKTLKDIFGDTSESGTQDASNLAKGVGESCEEGAEDVADSTEGIGAAFDALTGPIGIIATVVGTVLYELYEHCSTFRNGVNEICSAISDFVSNIVGGIESVVGGVVGWIENKFDWIMSIGDRIRSFIVSKLNFFNFAEIHEGEIKSKIKITHMVYPEFATIPNIHSISSVPIAVNSGEGFIPDLSFNMPELNDISFELVTDRIAEKMMDVIDRIGERPIVTKVQMNNKTIVEATHKEFNKVNGQNAELEARMRGVLVG